jgi:hypothetical protein
MIDVVEKVSAIFRGKVGQKDVVLIKCAGHNAHVLAQHHAPIKGKCVNNPAANTQQTHSKHKANSNGQLTYN